MVEKKAQPDKANKKKHTNIFATPEFRNHDFQADMKNDPELRPLDPVGKERLDYIWEKEIKN